MRQRTMFLGVLSSALLMMPLLASADSGDTLPVGGRGSITVEQRSPSLLGSWLLLDTQNGRNSGSGETMTLDVAAGAYTLFATPAEGATANIRVYKGSEQLQAVDRPQVSFSVGNGESIRVVINYAFTRVGEVLVQTDPPGIDFTMTDPNGQVYTDKTSKSYKNMSEGQYKVQFGTLPGCVTPPPKSALLESNKRITFFLTLSCAAADTLRERLNTSDDEFLNTNIDGNTNVTFRDVPSSSWFSPYVFNAARKGVLSGYKDETGRPTGTFGPENPVSIGELAKIIHRLAGVSEASFAERAPENPFAQNQWFSPFIASAESRGWLVFVDGTVDPSRPATRGEVLVTLMQALDITVPWPAGNVFSDVKLSTPYASSIEKAKDDGIVSGRTNAQGNPTDSFGPLDSINRAEMAKIVQLAMQTYLQD